MLKLNWNWIEFYNAAIDVILVVNFIKKKLRGFDPRANYADLATAAC
jgi:hypothetical protein